MTFDHKEHSKIKSDLVDCPTGGTGMSEEFWGSPFGQIEELFAQIQKNELARIRQTGAAYFPNTKQESDRQSVAGSSNTNEQVDEDVVLLKKKRPDVDPLEQQKRVETLIERLGSENFDQREAAGAELLAIGRPARDRLRIAVFDSDPEVGRRATDLLAKLPGYWHLGSQLQGKLGDAEQCKTTSQLLAKNKLTPEDVKKMKEAGPFGAVMVAQKLFDLPRAFGQEDRREELIRVLKDFGMDAAPAYLALLDDPESNESLRQIAREGLARLEREELPKLKQPYALHDYNGRLRLAWNPESRIYFSANYDIKGQLDTVQVTAQDVDRQEKQVPLLSYERKPPNTVVVKVPGIDDRQIQLAPVEKVSYFVAEEINKGDRYEIRIRLKGEGEIDEHLQVLDFPAPKKP